MSRGYYVFAEHGLCGIHVFSGGIYDHAIFPYFIVRAMLSRITALYILYIVTLCVNMRYLSQAHTATQPHLLSKDSFSVCTCNRYAACGGMCRGRSGISPRPTTWRRGNTAIWIDLSYIRQSSHSRRHIP